MKRLILLVSLFVFAMVGSAFANTVTVDIDGVTNVTVESNNYVFQVTDPGSGNMDAAATINVAVLTNEGFTKIDGKFSEGTNWNGSGLVLKCDGITMVHNTLTLVYTGTGTSFNKTITGNLSGYDWSTDPDLTYNGTIVFTCTT